MKGKYRKKKELKRQEEYKRLLIEVLQIEIIKKIILFWGGQLIRWPQY